MHRNDKDERFEIEPAPGSGADAAGSWIVPPPGRDTNSRREEGSPG